MVKHKRYLKFKIAACFIFTNLEAANDGKLRFARKGIRASQIFTSFMSYSLGERTHPGSPMLHCRVLLVWEGSPKSISSDRWFCCGPSPQHQYPLFCGELTRVSTLQSLVMNCKCGAIMVFEAQNTFLIVICGACFIGNELKTARFISW